MKKITISLFLILLCSTLFAYQQTYSENSYEYNTYLSLKRISGTILPQPTLPVSASQMSGLMRKMNTSAFDNETMRIYNELLQSIENPEMVFRYDNIGVDLDVNLSSEMFARTADYEYESGYSMYYDEDYIYKYKDYLPVSQINGLVFFNDYFTGGFFYDNQNLCYQENAKKKIWFNTFGTTIDSSAPHKAYGSLGYKSLNITIGRDRVSAGNGRTGNLGFGDNYQFQDYAKFSVINYPFSYDYTAVLFATEPTGDSYYTDTSLWNKKVLDFNFNDPVELAVQHRFSVALGKYATFSIYESALEYAKNALGDIRLLNPFMVIHGYTSFRDGNCNNWFGAELSAFLPKRHELNFQVMFDQIQRPVEYDENAPDHGIDTMSPNALGAIVNISKDTTIGQGILDTYVEAALVSHGMYHKELDSGNKHNFAGNVTDLVVGYEDNINYIGYSYGSNLLSVSMGASYTKSDMKFSANAMYLLRGNTRKDSSLITGKQFYWKVFPVIDRRLPGDSLEHRIILSSSAEVDVLDCVTLKGNLGYIHASNFRNVKNESFNDVQFTIGATIHCVDVVKKFIK